MIIKPIASGSSGNCYYVTDGITEILLDCGIPVNRIKEALWDMGTRLSNISGCLVTHSHGDHVKAAQRIADIGVGVYTSPGTIESAGLNGNYIKPVTDFTETGKRYSIGTFDIYAFTVEHDAPQTYSFLITSVAGDEPERLLYITDTEYFGYKIDGITHLMIEANYDPDILKTNADTGRIDTFRAKRTVKNHMSIDTALLTLSRLDMSLLKQVWLLHLSNDNAGQDFKRRAQEMAGVEVYIA